MPDVLQGPVHMHNVEAVIWEFQSVDVAHFKADLGQTRSSGELPRAL